MESCWDKGLPLLTPAKLAVGFEQELLGLTSMAALGGIKDFAGFTPKAD